MPTNTVPIYPGHGLGVINLGASLHEVFTIVQKDKATYPKIDLCFDRNHPLTIPTVISLPQNGFRLRFDGPEQRLRLIEIMDFTKIRLTYKGSELVKNPQAESGPAFKRTYTLFGASYPGEYLPPKNGSRYGRYILSWSGVAYTFPLEAKAWSPQKDHVSLLGSNAAGLATHMAIFEGSSWPEARGDIFIRQPSAARLSAIASRPKDNIPAEIEYANISSMEGRIELFRRPPATPFTILLNQTSPQDLITELGPPDASHKRTTSFHTAHEQPAHMRAGSMSNGLSRPHSYSDGRGSQPSSYSSTGTDTFDSDFDSGDADDDPSDREARETFWCYFSHGMDILVGPPSEEATIASHAPNTPTPLAASPHLVVTKVILHGNVPGSYAFNRHRRLRWNLSFPSGVADYLNPPLNSETQFSELKTALLHIHSTAQDGKRDAQTEFDMGKGKVVNRTWGDGGGGGADLAESGFFLPDAEADLVEGSGSEAWLGNTRVFTFPGVGFEVMEAGWVVGVTVY